ncbi:MAG: hypothetical protein ACE5HE_04005 [Phycisphaerae bacterium]
MTITARRARSIRRGCQRRSQYRNGLGISELFLAPAVDAEVIVAAKDIRLKLYLLGFSATLGATSGMPAVALRSRSRHDLLAAPHLPVSTTVAHCESPMLREHGYLQ